FGELTVSTDTEPRERCQTNSDTKTSINSSDVPPAYPIPNERSAKSASVVPTVVVAIIVAQYNSGWNCFAEIWAITATTKMAAKIPVPTRYPRFIDIDTASPPVSPSVVAAILMTQKIS